MATHDAAAFVIATRGSARQKFYVRWAWQRSLLSPPSPLSHALCVKFLSAAKNFEPRQAKRSKSASYAVTLAPGQARVVAKRAWQGVVRGEVS